MLFGRFPTTLPWCKTSHNSTQINHHQFPIIFRDSFRVNSMRIQGVPKLICNSREHYIILEMGVVVLKNAWTNGLKASRWLVIHRKIVGYNTIIGSSYNIQIKVIGKCCNKRSRSLLRMAMVEKVAAALLKLFSRLLPLCRCW